MAQVLVWLPSRGEGGGINVGHAALLADRATSPAYVSWWPSGDGASKSEPRTSSHVNNTYASDVQSEGGAPTVIDLPCLNDQLIADWWDLVKKDGFHTPYSLDVLPKSDEYDLYSNNCSTVVFRAMMMGGAMEIVKFPKFDIVTPPHLLAWAKAIAAVSGTRDWLGRALKK